MCLRVDAARLQATVIDELRDVFERYPGESEFVLEMDTRAGLRRLRFGADYRVAGRNDEDDTVWRELPMTWIQSAPPPKWRRPMVERAARRLLR